MIYWPAHVPLHFCLLFSWTHPSLRLNLISVSLRSVFLTSVMKRDREWYVSVSITS